MSELPRRDLIVDATRPRVSQEDLDQWHKDMQERADAIEGPAGWQDEHGEWHWKQTMKEPQIGDIRNHNGKTQRLKTIDRIINKDGTTITYGWEDWPDLLALAWQSRQVDVDPIDVFVRTLKEEKKDE